jgi:hypothetical protein
VIQGQRIGIEIVLAGPIYREKQSPFKFFKEVLIGAKWFSVPFPS